jgi:taurine dioxygenase
LKLDQQQDIMDDLDYAVRVQPLCGRHGCYPEIIEVRKEADDRGSNFDGAWHSDVTYLVELALGSILYAREVPDFGGDTLFASMYLAYDALSDGMRRMLDGMTAVHNAGRPCGPRSDWFPTQRAMDIRRSNSAQAEVEHPVVRTHPETGRKRLFVNKHFHDPLQRNERRRERTPPRLSLSPPSAARIHLPFPLERQPHRLLDNRCVQHYAINDCHGQRRVMHRVTVNGDRPY